MGNEGLATSFYNDMDEPLASFLARTLVDTGNTVPDFLEQYKPEDANNIDFDDDSGVEENDDLAGGFVDTSNENTDGGWGSAAPVIQPAVQDNGDSWGAGGSSWNENAGGAW